MDFFLRISNWLASLFKSIVNYFKQGLSKMFDRMSGLYSTLTRKRTIEEIEIKSAKLNLLLKRAVFYSILTLLAITGILFFAELLKNDNSYYLVDFEISEQMLSEGYRGKDLSRILRADILEIVKLSDNGIEFLRPSNTKSQKRFDDFYQYEEPMEFDIELENVKLPLSDFITFINRRILNKKIKIIACSIIENGEYLELAMTINDKHSINYREKKEIVSKELILKKLIRSASIYLLYEFYPKELGIYYYRIGNYIRGIELAKDIISTSGEYEKLGYSSEDRYLGIGYNLWGLCTAGLMRSDQAIKLYKKAIGYDPDYFGYYYNIGQEFQLNGIQDSSLFYYKEGYSKVMDVDPHTFSGIARSFYELREFDSAKYYCNRALIFNSSNFSSQFLLTKIFIAEGKLKKADSTFKVCLANNPYEVYYGEDNLLWLAEVSFKDSVAFCEGDLDKLSQYVDENSTFALGHFLLGYYYSRVDSTEKAKHYFISSIDKDIDFLISNLFLGRVYSSEGNFIEAQSCFMKYVSQFPENSIGWENIGNAYYFSGNYYKAKESYYKAIAINQYATYARINLSTIALAEGDYTGAALNLWELESYFPGSMVLRESLGDYYFDQGKYSLARDNYSSALEIDSTSIASFKGLADIALSYNDSERGLNYIQKSLTFYPKDELLLLKALCLSIAQNDKKETQKYYKLLLGSKNKEWAYLLLGINYSIQNQLAKADEYFGFSINQNPRNSITHLLRGINGYQYPSYQVKEKRNSSNNTNQIYGETYPEDQNTFFYNDSSEINTLPAHGDSPIPDNLLTDQSLDTTKTIETSSIYPKDTDVITAAELSQSNPGNDFLKEQIPVDLSDPFMPIDHLNKSKENNGNSALTPQQYRNQASDYYYDDFVYKPIEPREQFINEHLMNSIRANINIVELLNRSVSGNTETTENINRINTMYQFLIAIFYIKSLEDIENTVISSLKVNTMPVQVDQ